MNWDTLKKKTNSSHRLSQNTCKNLFTEYRCSEIIRMKDNQSDSYDVRSVSEHVRTFKGVFVVYILISSLLTCIHWLLNTNDFKLQSVRWRYRERWRCRVSATFFDELFRFARVSRKSCVEIETKDYGDTYAYSCRSPRIIKRCAGRDIFFFKKKFLTNTASRSAVKMMTCVYSTCDWLSVIRRRHSQVADLSVTESEGELDSCSIYEVSDIKKGCRRQSGVEFPIW